LKLSFFAYRHFNIGGTNNGPCWGQPQMLSRLLNSRVVPTTIYRILYSLEPIAVLNQ
jgi:hypothetical protein